MIVSESQRTYEYEELIHVAKRENNLKRKLLFVNKKQGKYVPTDPTECIALFHRLGEEAKKVYDGKKVTVIGFAETATALGAFSAEIFGKDTYYLHTTRRVGKEEDKIIDFTEEHSHATEHALYCNHKNRLKESDLIVILDDEFTTGKTICNIVDTLREAKAIAQEAKIIAGSILNCMKSEDFNRFKQRNIDCIYIIKKEVDANEEIDFGQHLTDSPLKADGHKINYDNIACNHREELFCGIEMGRYKEACEDLYKEVLATHEEIIPREEKKNILVLGTEEFMYPAILFAQKLKEDYPQKNIMVHATARSPIVPIANGGYPIHNRTKLESIYDKRRHVFLYNLCKYDKVIVLTDAEQEAGGFEGIAEVIAHFGNEDMTFIRWEK